MAKRRPSLQIRNRESIDSAGSVSPQGAVGKVSSMRSVGERSTVTSRGGMMGSESDSCRNVSDRKLKSESSLPKLDSRASSPRGSRGPTPRASGMGKLHSAGDRSSSKSMKLPPVIQGRLSTPDARSAQELFSSRSKQQQQQQQREKQQRGEKPSAGASASGSSGGSQAHPQQKGGKAKGEKKPGRAPSSDQQTTEASPTASVKSDQEEDEEEEDEEESGSEDYEPEQPAPTSPAGRLSMMLRSATLAALDGGENMTSAKSMPMSKRLGRRRLSQPLIVDTEVAKDNSHEPASPLMIPITRRRHSLCIGGDLLKALSSDIDPQKWTRLREIEVLKDGEKIFDRFSWDTVLQEQGDGGKVVICRRKIDGMSPKMKEGTNEFEGEELVLKMRPKERMGSGEVDHYRRVLHRQLNLVRHPGVMPLEEVMEDEKFFYVVMGKAEGGSLIDGLLRRFTDGVIPAEAMKELMRDLLTAVGHVHNQGMLHRDIKPDNLVLHRREKGATERVMLIDFDHADPDFDTKKTEVNSSEWVGTARFSAPETFLGTYSRQSDLYSVGVVLYLLMAGKMPVDDDIFSQMMQSSKAMRGQNQEAMVLKIYNDRMQAKVDWDCSPWPDQPECKDFCQMLINTAPKERFETTKDALAHGWLA